MVATILAVIAIYIAIRSWKLNRRSRNGNDIELQSLTTPQPQPASPTSYTDAAAHPGTASHPPPINRALSDTFEAVARVLRVGA
ncbi:hypothetical protein GLAREA_06254 [Glarea lozoyensis ATCC 20868]|uniref:Uncharacterized protein n=1 Tax=Glarea lozoyensis (strain ATCC 20868 / MF5171) TaxID=1116229 RepID=S3D458_GLAL2|nr:uncharacterized protein GLAREA_06254 [Glarea lozoyensis ATCC 20868]EPE33242.1 hypothetical protein GLAREA_06254 [Glarea lozoyensis ATCC 20868]